ncbi:Putative serine protease HhoB [Mycolicibacterium hassiacum DSM 44199]|nr:trypsin-like peptidase domain-containing protein [Mycolicibacterium hassiacum]MBX5486930.1 trypsin-like peptidase domain-containing protein [Mycolicibacterium hassiacum]VCT90657.1 Putative serine protease HhoB [Mycolicibacterium hassiacum DSM 44199]
MALLIPVSACGTQRASAPPTDTATTSAEAPPAHSAAPVPGGYADLVERVSPSVVSVERDGGAGSGVVLRPDVVVTNAHVVGNARRVKVILEDGESTPGEVIGVDRVTDLALVRTERGGLPVPEFRTELPRPGEVAIAIGSPLGFQNSVTAGIISGLHRDIPGSAAQSQSLVDLIQTDAPISPGNSGGALLDAEGRVVGINEAYIPPEAGAVSLGFAIPSATVLDIADQLLEKGVATHPYLGVSVGRVTSAIQRTLGVTVDHGALVTGVDRDAPALQAGLRAGDVIVEFAGKPVESVENLLSALRRTEPGSRQPLVYVRGGERERTTVTVGSRTGG